MNSLKKLASFWTVCLLACGLATSVYAHDAKVVKLTGDVQVQLPGESEAKPLTADMAIPQGSTIITGPGAEVYVEALPGVVATIKANTTVSVEKLAIEQQGGVVTSQEALLDLKKGSIISTLDPTKKAINHYGVKTPKGVAAARGTVYGTTVTFDAGGEANTSVATLSGTVRLNLSSDPNNPVYVDIPFGQAATAEGAQAATVGTIAEKIAASGQSGLTVEQLLQEAVEAVAANVAANTSAAGGSDTATAVLAAVVSAASSAQPQKADQFVNTAVAAAVSAGSTTGGSTTTSNAAVAAIVGAGVRAAPAAAATISQGAAATVVQTKTTQAAAAARAAGGGDTAATEAAAAAASEAAATLSTIAQTAVNTAAASGSAVNATQITNAVNTGSQQGAAAANAAANVTVTVTPPSVSQPTANTQSSPTINTPQTTVDLPPVSPTSPVR